MARLIRRFILHASPRRICHAPPHRPTRTLEGRCLWLWLSCSGWFDGGTFGGRRYRSTGPQNRLTFPPGPSGSSSCSCRAASARLIRYDYKPRLAQDDGKQMPFDDARVLANTGMRGLVATGDEVPLEIRPARRMRAAGVPSFSPRSTGMSTTLTFLHALSTEGVAHGPATLFLPLRRNQHHPAVDGLLAPLRPRH